LAQVATGKWSSIVPAHLPQALGLLPTIKAVPLVSPEVSHLVGLIVPTRYAMSPLTNALVREAGRLGEHKNTSHH